jgi:dTDP-4-dehydrorhamnose reductase
MIKILVTGSYGQLGREIIARADSYKDYKFTYTDLNELDITDTSAVNDFLFKGRFDVLINCAGYTNVDKAEEEPEIAMEVNARAVKNLVKAANSTGTFPIHISTDYVFGNIKSRPYTEEDLPAPLSAYARSKYEGEKLFLENTDKGLIFRLSWLHSIYGKNFVKTILSLSQSREELRVVSDQVGTPTWSGDFISTLLALLPTIIMDKKKEIYHYSNEGVSSWYDFARAIVEISGNTCSVIPISTEEYPLPASRPYYSLMDKSKIRKDFNIEIPHWHTGLINMMHQLKKSNS